MNNNRLDKLIELRDNLLRKKEELRNYKGEFSEYNRMLKDINKQLENIEIKIFFTKDPDNTNGIIDLRKIDDRVYNLYLSGTDTYVGFIEYNGYHVSRRTGDVGCKIKVQYRGNGYAYYANVLLGDLLYKEGIKDFWGTAFKENIGSIKLMEKYGGKIIEDGVIPGVVLYECKTRPLLEEELKNNTKITR